MSKKPRSNLQPYRKSTIPRRNDSCPCGSGKKAKRCCLSKIQALALLAPEARTRLMVDHILQKPIGAIAEPEITAPEVDIESCTLAVQPETPETPQ
jgi:hypothetical protein